MPVTHLLPGPQNGLAHTICQIMVGPPPPHQCAHTSMLSVHPILTSIVSDNDLVNEVRHALDKRLMQLDAYQWVELSVVQ